MDIIIRQFLYNFNSNPADIIFKNQKFYLKAIAEKKEIDEKYKILKNEADKTKKEVTGRIASENQEVLHSDFSSKFINRTDLNLEKLVSRQLLVGKNVDKVHYTQIEVVKKRNLDNLCQ